MTAVALDLPVLSFSTPAEWQAWLDTHHAQEQGIWLRMYKKATGLASVTYAQALDEALCYGWIDGQSRTYDDKSYIQRFTPRRSRSVWSKINRGHIERLTVEGKMMPAGLAAVAAAKADGRWAAAYDSPKTMKVPDDFLLALQADPTALTFFEGLSKTNKFIIASQLQLAKRPETRARRLEKYLEMMKRGEKVS